MNELYPAEEVVAEEPRGTRLVKVLFFAGVTAALGGLFLSLYLYWQLSRGLPRIISLADYRPYGVTKVVTLEEDQEKILGEFYKERRYVVKYEDFPPLVSQSFIAAEDDRFFEHKGISLSAILRASIANFRAGYVVQGGSTITQQVAKSLFLTPERSYIRKIKEAILASRIESNLTKEQILFLYLNQIYLGHGAYGVEAAGRAYFRKSTPELTLGELALLAGLPRAPSAFNPFTNPSRAKQRQLYVLKRMNESGFITQEQMMEAASKPLRLYPVQDINLEYAPYFVEHVRRYLLEEYGEAAVYQEGLKVFVPSRKAVYEAASKSVRDGLRAVDKRRGFRGAISHLAGAEEIQKFSDEQREQVIKRKLDYQLLLPDGKLGVIEAIAEAGLTAESQLLDVDQTFHAVVTELDDLARVAKLLVGHVPVVLPMNEMEWARPVSDAVTKPRAPRLPSEVLSKGDVVLVRIVRKEAADASPASLKTPEKAAAEIASSGVPERVIVALEQEPEVQGALLSIEAGTGNVLAMVGGYEFAKSEFNRATQAKRQSGSAFKPVIYSAAIERGYTPSSIIVDSPIVYKDDETGKWKPANFSERFYGDTTLRMALIKSRNIPTIKLVQDLQVPSVIQYARRLGMEGEFNEDLSISLGSGTTTLLELCKVYGLFPRMGRRVDPIFIRKVVDRDGQVLEENLPQLVPDFSRPDEVMLYTAANIPRAVKGPEAGPAVPGAADAQEAKERAIDDPTQPADELQRMDPRVAYVMTRLLKDVVDFGTGRSARSLAKSVAGKTGTTNEYKDAWFMGFTPHVITGVWVGFDDQRSMGGTETGAGAALPIWTEFMKEAIKGYPDTDFAIPNGVVLAATDNLTGRLTMPDASNSRIAAFLEGSEPTEVSRGEGDSVDSESEFLKESYE
ncbi:MAG: PBP1A family penicillin-binding protein [Bdellovibrionales bacterium]|nr:PBP1A family penicillin-binding protein [Bdellovibrionales bacterium]